MLDRDGELTKAGLDLVGAYAARWLKGMRDLEVEASHPKLAGYFIEVRAERSLAKSYARVVEIDPPKLTVPLEFLAVEKAFAPPKQNKTPPEAKDNHAQPANTTKRKVAGAGSKPSKDKEQRHGGLPLVMKTPNQLASQNMPPQPPEPPKGQDPGDDDPDDE